MVYSNLQFPISHNLSHEAYKDQTHPLRSLHQLSLSLQHLQTQCLPTKPEHCPLEFGTQMLRPFQQLAKRLYATQSNTTPIPSSSSSWRSKAQEFQLVSQISNILCERYNWPYLLTTLNLSSSLTPPLIRHILSRTLNNPHISLQFLDWAKTNLGFKPDVKTHLTLVRILVRSGKTQHALPILDSVVEGNPPVPVVDSLVRACEGTEGGNVAVLSSVIERYSKKGSLLDGLGAYFRVLVSGVIPEIGCCNVLLDKLGCAGEFRVLWCLYGSMIRIGVLLNSSTWSVIARALCKSGKQERVARLLDSGVYTYVAFNIIVEWHCKSGNFGGALDQLNEMFCRKVEPGFSTYSSILDAACEFGDEKVIEMILEMMTKKKLIPGALVSEDYDSVIERLCDLGKTYAAEMLLKRSVDDGVGLKDGTFVHMMRALAKGGRVAAAMDLYLLISQKGIVVIRASLKALGDSLCLENPSPEVSRSLTDLIAQGVDPGVNELSRYMTLLCRQKRWDEAGELLRIVLDRGIMFDSSCCRLLVMNYCSCGQVDSALSLHDRLEKLEMVLDVAAYNQLLRTVFGEKRVEEAERVFDYMRKKNVLSRASFMVMISGLSTEKEMRKAMKVHDEMLKLGMKPSSKTYKNLISVFR